MAKSKEKDLLRDGLASLEKFEAFLHKQEEKSCSSGYKTPMEEIVAEMMQLV